METLKAKLESIKTRIEGNLPPAYLKIMHSEVQRLKASPSMERVLRVGDTAPEFELVDQHGKPKPRAELLARGPLAISFYRGFWCPYCNADLAHLERAREAIEAAGGTLIAITPEKPEYSRKIIGMQRLGFDILTDPRNEVAAAFGLRFSLPEKLKELYRDQLSINLKLYHGDDDWTLPMPARFVVDAAGTIRYAESCPDYTCRPEPDELLAALKELQAC